MKEKVDFVINGNLICKKSLMGGGKIYSCNKNDLDVYYDTKDAIHIDGDVLVDSFNFKHKTVVVTGSISAKGGIYG